jgi:hypothetical protein
MMLIHAVRPDGTECHYAISAFSGALDTGSREENASKQEVEPRSDSIGTNEALVGKRCVIDLGDSHIRIGQSCASTILGP